MKKISGYSRKKRDPLAHELDLICLSHLRWNFVYQRPQHLLNRAARRQRVFFVEEPIFHQDPSPRLDIRRESDRLLIAVPYLPDGCSESDRHVILRRMLDDMIERQGIERYIAWYYTPMALKFTRHLRPDFAVYDCMDQLSHFKGAPPELPRLEQELFQMVDVVFTGGHSLYEAKQYQHSQVHPFPSSVDVAHFAKGRIKQDDPEDQRAIPGPRIGYIGVIDERIDLELLEGMARLRPDWSIVMVGPVVKIDPATLPRLPNIYYLGGKSYEELPCYLHGWDIAILPFARNDATRFISPTKTPEYLAAGRRVISTSIRDVVYPYAQKRLISIADDPETFVAIADQLLANPARQEQWLQQVDQFLSRLSWDRTFASMWQLIDLGLEEMRKSTEKSRVELSTAIEDLGILTQVLSPSGSLSGKIAIAPG